MPYVHWTPDKCKQLMHGVLDYHAKPSCMMAGCDRLCGFSLLTLHGIDTDLMSVKRPNIACVVSYGSVWYCRFCHRVYCSTCLLAHAVYRTNTGISCKLDSCAICVAHNSCSYAGVLASFALPTDHNDRARADALPELACTSS